MSKKSESAPGSDPAGEKPRCGLCGKAGKLTRTSCCGNWICDDADQYVAFSDARNSCFTNHSKYTICSVHHHEGHAGRWQDCAPCRANQPLELFVEHGTNEYNFEKLENPPSFITAAVASGRLWYPCITFGPRTRISPSGAIRMVTPGIG